MVGNILFGPYHGGVMPPVLDRPRDLEQVQRLLAVFPVVAILGARQVGKTTLAGMIPHRHHFDLENPRDLRRLEEPQLALEGLAGLVVIDEIQRKPELFPLLRYLVDQDPGRRFLVLGSASRDLIRQGSETLAGRIGFCRLGGFSIDEVGEVDLSRLWLRGGLPRSFLADSDDASELWRQHYVTTFLERDIPSLGIAIPAPTLRRFWMMVSHYHGQQLNLSELGRAFGISDTTVRRYLDILVGTFMVRLLPPWHANLKKRQVRRPKLYLRDTGLLHALAGIEDNEQLLSWPRLGASWEGFALESLLAHLPFPEESFHFWAVHTGAEVDLFWIHRGKGFGVDFKYADAPARTRSMQSALEALELERLWVIFPRGEPYALSEKIHVVPLAQARDEISRVVTGERSSR